MTKEKSEMLKQRFEERERLIAEGMEIPNKMVYGFSPEGRKAFERGRTMEEILNELEQKFDKT
jgi:hypothetical protein